MKVLHVIPSVSERSGGPAQAIFPMCRSLMARGLEVTLATTTHGLSDLNGHLTSPQIYQGTPTYFFPVRDDGFKYSRPFKIWLDENVQSFDLVHIHAVFNHSSIAASTSCRKHLVPYVVRPLGTLDPWSMQQKSFRKSLFWTLAGKRMLKSAGTIHYTAQAEFDLVKRSLGLKHGTVVPLGIERNSNGSKSVTAGEPAAFPSRTGVGQGQARTPAPPAQYVLFLSRLHPKKGLDVLIRAFIALQKNEKFSTWRLMIAGDGDSAYVDSLKRIVAENTAADVVRFIGWVSGDEKREVIRNASLLVLPSRQENFGLCVLEALAEGVPVVISRDVNLAQDIVDAGAGWITDVTVADLKSTLAEVLADKQQGLSRGLAGKHFSQAFTWDAIAERLEAMYLSILKGMAAHQ